MTAFRRSASRSLSLERWDSAADSQYARGSSVGPSAGGIRFPPPEVSGMSHDSAAASDFGPDEGGGGGGGGADENKRGEV